MLKRILSLILSVVLLLQVSSFTTIANKFDDDQNVEKMDHILKIREDDYCSAYPKNICGNTVDVGCARKELYRNILESNINTDIFENVDIGNKCEAAIYAWKYSGLTSLANTFNKWINTNNKDENKHRYFSEFVLNTKKLLNKTSEDSAEIVKRFLKKSRYTKELGITENEIDKWKKEITDRVDIIPKKVESDTKSIVTGGTAGLVLGGITGWGIHGYFAAKAAATLATAAAAPALAPFVAAGGVVAGLTGLYVGNYWGKEKKTAQRLAEIAEEELEEAHKNEIHLDVYSYAIENIFNSIQREEYLNNNILEARLDFNKHRPSAFIKFMNLSTQTVDCNVSKIFENLSNSLSKLIDKFNLNKEAL